REIGIAKWLDLAPDVGFQRGPESERIAPGVVMSEEAAVLWIPSFALELADLRLGLRDQLNVSQPDAVRCIALRIAILGRRLQPELAEDDLCSVELRNLPEVVVEPVPAGIGVCDQRKRIVGLEPYLEARGILFAVRTN